MYINSVLIHGWFADAVFNHRIQWTVSDNAVRNYYYGMYNDMSSEIFSVTIHFILFKFHNRPCIIYIRYHPCKKTVRVVACVLSWYVFGHTQHTQL